MEVFRFVYNYNHTKSCMMQAGTPTLLNNKIRCIEAPTLIITYSLTGTKIY